MREVDHAERFHAKLNCERCQLHLPQPPLNQSLTSDGSTKLTAFSLPGSTNARIP